MNSKLHVVCDGQGRPLVMLLSEGQMSDYKGAALMFDAIPDAGTMLADKGYDADWFRAALKNRGIRRLDLEGMQGTMPRCLRAARNQSAS